MIGGEFVNQKFGKVGQCPLSRERAEPFLHVPLPVHHGSLQVALETHVKREVMKGDNAVNCDECGTKVDTVISTCIKTLPSLLVFHIKRFEYDYDRMMYTPPPPPGAPSFPPLVSFRA